MRYQLGDIYLAHFPLEEDQTKYLDRPIIIILSEFPKLIVIKVTKTAPRTTDPYDVPIKKYKEAGLTFPSTARVAKIITIKESQVIHKIGKIHSEDLEVILEKLNHLADNT